MYIDDVKKRLNSTKNQKKRREILLEYSESDFNEMDRLRYIQLKEKANLPTPLIKKFFVWGLILYIPAWIVTIFIGLPLLRIETNNIGIYLLWAVVGVTSIWNLMGPIIEIVLGVILLNRRRKENYYLNIKKV